MGKEWIKVKEIGQLYLERILVSFDMPILFVCVDYENRKYLCLNIYDENVKSVIVETDINQLIAMLKNRVTMESVFRRTVGGNIVVAEYNSKKQEVVSHVESANEISEDMLPKKNEYFEIENKMIDEYIILLQRQLMKIVIEAFSEKMSFKIERCELISNYATEEIIACECKSVVISETQNKCSYDVNGVNRMIA